MTQSPDFEARLRAQEHTASMLQGRVEEIARDMIASFQQLARYYAAPERELDIRFRHIDARLDRLEAHMAMKEDLAALENKFEQRFITLENRFDTLENRFEQRFASQDSKIDSVLQTLAVLTKKIAE